MLKDVSIHRSIWSGFAALRDRCSLNERVRSKVTPRYLRTGHASDSDHSCEHPVHGVTCYYAGGKRLSQAWTCLVSYATGSQLTVFGKMGKIGCQRALCLVESFRLEGTAECHWHR